MAHCSAKYMRDYRKKQREQAIKERNRLAFLELEVERLQKCLEYMVETMVSRLKTLKDELFFLPQSSGD